MKKRTVFLMIGLLMAFTGSGLAGNTIAYPPDDPALTVAFPEGWTKVADPDWDKGIIVTSPDEEIEIDLWALDEKDLQEDPNLEFSIEEVKTIIKEWVVDFQAGPIETFVSNGIRFVGKQGSGKSKEDGSPVKVSAYFFSPDRKTVFVLMYWGSAEAEARYASELKAIARSVNKP